ncbi:MAG: methyltransferase protein [Piccolia ochrophora]|nr:MAG: methyltransferase protein [Piccolia ochrophora]
MSNQTGTNGAAAAPDDFCPNFYIGQHESKRALPVSDLVLGQAQDSGYDMLTTPITTPHFHSRVLTLLSAHLSSIESSPNASPSTEPLPPTVPTLTPVDTPLTPTESISQFLAVSSPWIDLCSPDPVIADVSRQVFTLEIAYAAFCGIGNVITQGPDLRDAATAAGGLAQYARAILEALTIAPYMSISIWMPMIDHAEPGASDQMGSLAPFARERYSKDGDGGAKRYDWFGTWDAWHVIRRMCKYSPRLFVALSLPRHLPPLPVQDRWFCEPLRVLSLQPATFIQNKNGYPVLSKTQQALISRYMRLRSAPWLLLADVGPLPGANNPETVPIPADGLLSPSMTVDASCNGGSPSPSPSAEGFSPHQGKNESSKKKRKDYTPHLSYIRYLQRNQPPRTTLERFGSGYQDYLQAPLQPLTDNLESITYEVFEKDPVKYDWYERAIVAALRDWSAADKPRSGPNNSIAVAVVGAGRGPLVTRALNASAAVDIPIDMWAVEKNQNAYVLLQRHNVEAWAGRVHVVHSDMREWTGPSQDSASHDASTSPANKVDIIISELLGSFADNELSPECLDGAQHVLHPGSISIPTSYTAHLTPISAPRLRADINVRATTDAAAAETPYVVMLHAMSFLSNFPSLSNNPTEPAKPNIQEAWSFQHPLPDSRSRMDRYNRHNVRSTRLRFSCAHRGACDGVAGYFEAVLWGDVELSTRPDTMAQKSKDMISWFPIYFPLKVGLLWPWSE